MRHLQPLTFRGRCSILAVAIVVSVLNHDLGAQQPETAPSAFVGENEASTYAKDPAILAEGQALFAQHCASCHALMQDGIGPPLGGVTSLLSRARLRDWIREPQKVIDSGDSRAAALLQRYKVPMPPFSHLQESEVSAILAYINEQSRSQNLSPLEVERATLPGVTARWSPPVKKSDLTIELEEVVEIPRLAGRTAYKGITLLRADPRQDGALFVDELMGLLYRFDGDAKQLEVFLDVRPFFPQFLCDPGVASGLGSFALHPDFIRNGRFYTIHSETFRRSPAVNATDIPADVPKWETPPLEWVLTEWRLNDPAARVFEGTHREVMRFVTPTTGHAAQEIAFAPVSDSNDTDYGKLYIAVGDGGSGNLGRPDMAGHPRTFLGAILRIDPAGRTSANGQYGIPADNPFSSNPDPAIRKEIWAYGFRNPHRFSWDLMHEKRLISVDIGEANVEEVNLIEKGGAYGWGVAGVEGRTRIDVRTDLKVVRAASPAELANIHLPFGEYDHVDGAAITGGYVYRGPLEALRGKYVFGDIVNGRLFYMNMGADLSDQTVYELNVSRNGVRTTIKELAKASRAHLRIGYDDRSGDLFVLTKDDGMIRKVTAAYEGVGKTASSSP